MKGRREEKRMNWWTDREKEIQETGMNGCKRLKKGWKDTRPSTEKQAEVKIGLKENLKRTIWQTERGHRADWQKIGKY